MMSTIFSKHFSFDFDFYCNHLIQKLVLLRSTRKAELDNLLFSETIGIFSRAMNSPKLPLKRRNIGTTSHPECGGDIYF